MNSVNSKIWPPMKVAPNSAVAMIQIWKRRSSPRWIAESASTIVRLLISRMNDVTDVNGMLNTSAGVGPFWPGRSRYSRNVEMNAPKNRQSDDRNSHMPSFGLMTPVWVSCAASVVAPVRDRRQLALRLFDGHQCSVPTSTPGSVAGSRPQA